MEGDTGALAGFVEHSGEPRCAGAFPWRTDAISISGFF